MTRTLLDGVPLLLRGSEVVKDWREARLAVRKNILPPASAFSSVIMNGDKFVFPQDFLPLAAGSEVS
jgi:hypothetical protein